MIRTLLALAAARSRQEAEELRTGAMLAEKSAELMEDVLVNGSDEDCKEILSTLGEASHVG